MYRKRIMATQCDAHRPTATHLREGMAQCNSFHLPLIIKAMRQPIPSRRCEGTAGGRPDSEAENKNEAGGVCRTDKAIRQIERNNQRKKTL